MDCNYGDTEDTRTIYCANLASKITEEILYELFLQAGPLERVHIPIDREGRLAPYGFVTFKHKCSVGYALKLFEDLHLYNCKLVLKPRKKQENFEQNPLVTPSKHSPLSPMQNNQNRTPSGRNDHYRNNEHFRNESLQGRFSGYPAKRGRDIMRPNDNHRRIYKKHKRQGNL